MLRRCYYVVASMLYFFVLILILSVVVSIVLLNYNGRRQFLNFDVVQFFFSFIIVPVLFVWSKSFLFYLLRIEVGKTISLNQFFIWDTMFSVVFLFVSTFVVIHSLTKSFELHREKDPLVDLYELSEYFHQTFSHLAIYLGAFVLLTTISVINLLVPVDPNVTTRFYPGLALGIASGVVAYLAVVSYESATRQFLRIMKVAYGFTFLVHVLLYFIVSPPFTSTYVMYWITLIGSMTLIFLALFAKQPEHKMLLWLPFVIHPKKGVAGIKNGIKLVSRRK